MKRWLEVFTVLSLLVLIILPACGKETEKTPAPTPTMASTASVTFTPTVAQTTTPTVTLTATATPAPSGPVKIGAIAPWSGPLAMTGMLADPVIALVEKQVKEMGGILGGREVKFVKYDSRGTVAEVIAGATKLLKDDKVSALVYGGSSGSDNIAVSDFAEANHILYVCYSGDPRLAEEKFTVTGSSTVRGNYTASAGFTNKVLKPKTIAILASDLADSHDYLDGYKKEIETAGTKIVYEQYTPLETTDFMSYLTKIKYVKPDVLLIFYQASEACMAIAKQIMELGGWGDIKVVTVASAESAAKLPGAQGWYVFVLWLPGLTYPGAVKFQQDFQSMYNRMPSSLHVYFYIPLWTAIYAIDLAGTDTDLEKIAQAARSGMLEWETPMGRAHYTTEGDAGLYPSAAQVEEQKLVPVQVPE